MEITLLSRRKELFSTMMCSEVEVYGGYAINYSQEEIEKELNFRNVKMESL